MSDYFRIIGVQEARRRSANARQAARAAASRAATAIPIAVAQDAGAATQEELRALQDGAVSAALDGLESGLAQARETSPDDYLQRLLKLIPAEAVAAYGAGHVLASSVDGLAWWAATCLVLAFILRVFGTRPEDVVGSFDFKGVQWPAVFSATVAFAIWVYTLGDTLPWLGAAVPPAVATLTAIVYAILVPYFVKGD